MVPCYAVGSIEACGEDGRRLLIDLLAHMRGVRLRIQVCARVRETEREDER